MKAQVGCSFQNLLCEQLGVGEDYLTNRIQTIILDGKPVDDENTAIVHDGSTLALSIALGSIFGASFRKAGVVASFRSGGAASCISREEAFMKILGIVGSSRKEGVSGVHQLVTTVLENTAFDYELVTLRGKKIGGCIACLGCVKDNICKLNDDLTELRPLIAEADAYVIGAPNYYSALNALTHAFLERWYQFRHQEGDTLWGKLGVAVGVGGASGTIPADDIEKFLLYNFVETIAKVSGQGAASCFSCGYGETCKVGAVNMLFGEGTKITEEIIPQVYKQPEVMEAAIAAGKLLGERLRGNHDREAVTERMQKTLMKKFAEST